MRTLFVTILVVATSAVAQEKREVGALVLDGVPEVPRSVSDRMNQYQNTRGASLIDWQPDGKALYVSTRFGDSAQVHVVGGPGLDRRQLTFFPEPVRGAVVDPSSNDGFLISMDTGGAEFYQLHWYSRITGRAELLTDGKSRNESANFSGKGDRFAFVSTRRNGKDFDIYVQRRSEPGSARLVKEVEGQWSILDWSPDEKQLLVEKYVSINESYLFTLDLDGGALTAINDKPGERIGYGAAAYTSPKTIIYTSDEGAEFQQLTGLDLKTKKKTVYTAKIPWDVAAFELSRDLKQIAFLANEGGTSGLYLGATAAPDKAKRVNLPKGVISSMRFDAKGKRLAISFNAADNAEDTWVLDTVAKKPVRWTFSETGGLEPKNFVPIELVEYASFDGKKIPAWYYRPRPTGKKSPVVINIHGGPEAQSLAWFNPIAQYLANELGVAMVLPNVRGSSGYGKSSLQLDNGKKREDSVKDIGALLDWVASRPELDASRVAILGGSYGGYMTLATLTNYPDRVKCGVDVVGISHFVTFLQKTEPYRQDLRRAEYGDERDPDMKAFLDSISPLTNAKKITKPLFVVQGFNDPRVPVAEAEQIVKTVRESGQTVWYMLAKDEGHGMSKKKNRDAYLNAMSLFFEKFLLN